ncbi:MAG: malate dehydrogenase [Candidatus Dasytiphilus stammeri]
MKIVVLGAAGGIGQALALLLKINLPVGSELYLYDILPVILGIAADLSHIPTSVKVQGFSSRDIKHALHGADIVVMCAGVARKPGMKRGDLFNVNAEIVYNLCKHISNICPQSLIGIITNPINSTVSIAAEVLKTAGVYNKNKLFGITTLDINRANTLVAELKGKILKNFKINVIGGHSRLTILPLLSQIPDIIFTANEIEMITKNIQNAGTEVVKAKAGSGSATLSMGYAALNFIISMVMALHGGKNIVECAYVEGDGKYAKFFAQPVLLGKEGIAQLKPIGPLSHFEKTCLDQMLETLRKDIKIGQEFVKQHV